MTVLSITQGHDTGAAIVENGKLVAAVNEERFSRVKQDTHFPYRSIESVLAIAGKRHEDIQHVVIPEFRKMDDIRKNILVQYPKGVLAGAKGKTSFRDRFFQIAISLTLLLKTYSQMVILYSLYERRVRRLFPNATIHRVEHHLTHAASGYYTSGFDQALIVTADAWGDFVSTMVSIGRGKEITVQKRMYYPHSLGHYYQSLTNWLGFKGGRHEGKIVGLAAFGDPNSPAYDVIKDLLVSTGDAIYAPLMMGKLWHKRIALRPNCLMRRLKRTYSREDISAVFQRRFEEVVTDLVRYYVQATGIGNVVLAGGIFANVKLNQRIFETAGVKQVFVFPNMGDGGVAAGGALYVDVHLNGSNTGMVSDMYLGPSYTEVEMEQALKEAGLVYARPHNLEIDVAKLLADSKVVARFDGRMEYGPRALGNRTIMYQATDPSVNDWLNERLKRSEFMPFAPVTMIEHAGSCYKNLKGAEYPARFMTITFDCTDFMRKVSPAAIHVDGTARPQLISRDENPSYYGIVEAYHKITGIPSVINTSFNMHEEPIVCTPEDAIRAFLLGHLDYLIMGPFLVENPGAVPPTGSKP